MAFRVRAVNAAGSGPGSEFVHLAPDDPAVLVVPPGRQIPLLDTARQSLIVRLQDIDCRVRVWWQPWDAAWYGSIEVPTNRAGRAGAAPRRQRRPARRSGPRRSPATSSAGRWDSSDDRLEPLRDAWATPHPRTVLGAETMTIDTTEFEAKHGKPRGRRMWVFRLPGRRASEQLRAPGQLRPRQAGVPALRPAEPDRAARRLAGGAGGLAGDGRLMSNRNPDIGYQQLKQVLPFCFSQELKNVPHRRAGDRARLRRPDQTRLGADCSQHDRPRSTARSTSSSPCRGR